MKRLLSIWTGALLALAAPLAAAQQQGVTADTITIGAYGPITGPAAYIGLAGRDGMLLAIKEINAAGGINGRKINVVFEDDTHSPTRALAAVKKLVEQDKVFAIMSVAGSNATVGTIDYVREKGVVMYVSIASAPPVTWPHARNMFRGGTTETARYGELYAEYLATNAANKRIAIMHGREEYPRNEAEATIAKLKSLVRPRAGRPRRVQHQRQGLHVAADHGAEGQSGRHRVLRQPGGGGDRDAAGARARHEAAVLRRQQHGRPGPGDRCARQRGRSHRLFADSAAAGSERARDEGVGSQLAQGVSERAGRPPQQL